MSFANPGSRQASSIGSLRRRPVLPGNFLTDPQFMPQAMVASDKLAYPSDYAGSLITSAGSSFWGVNQYYGVNGTRTTSDYTADIWKTIVSVSGSRGIISNIVGPMVQSNAANQDRFFQFRVTLDGVSHLVVFPQETVLFYGYTRPILGALSVWRLNNPNSQLMDVQAIQNGAGQGPQQYYYSNKQATLTGGYNHWSPIYPHQAMSMTKPVLYFSRSMSVEIMSVGQGLTDDGQYNCYSGCQYLLGLGASR